MPLTRRNLLQQAVALSTGAFTRHSLALSPAASEPARLTLHPGKTIAAIPPSFIGLGYEISSVTRPGLFAPRGKYINLVRSLGPHGVIRIGGNTADFARFAPHGTAVSSPKGTVVTQAALDQLRQFLEATGWQLIWSVNLGSGPGQKAVDEAVEEAVAIATTMGPRLLALEIGNEPDLFFVEHRPKPYTYEQFRSEFMLFRNAILKRLPHLPLAGPDAAVSNDWVRRFAADEPRNLKLLTQHYYREGQNPTSTADKLLHADPRLPAALAELRSVSAASGLPYRICEVNSFSGGGRPGVSDTFASALWVLDYMLLLAQNGCSGVNMETGVNQLGFVSSYSPIFENADGSLTARPEFYGMLAFQEATGNGSAAMIQSDLEASGANVTAYAVERAPGQLAVVLVNKDTATDVDVRIETSNGRLTPSAITRLLAPSLEATEGVTLGGRSVTPTGEWTGTGAKHEANTGSVDVPAGSAAIVSLRV